MAKTTDVAGGQQIIAPWGNEIRDKTIQQFATFTELNAWAAPDGAVAKLMSSYELWHRIKGAWYGQPLTYVYSGNATTDAFGNFIINVPLSSARTTGGLCLSSQTAFPKYFTINNTDMPIGSGPGLMFNGRQTSDNAPAANSTISVSATIYFTVI